MPENHNTEIPTQQTESSKLWNRIKKSGLYATSIAGAIVTIIGIYTFIQSNHKHPDLSGEWQFQFINHLPSAAEFKGLQENYNVSIRVSGSRNETVEGNGNCIVPGTTDSSHFTDNLIINRSKFDDDSLLLNYELMNHSEMISNGVIKLITKPGKDGCYCGLFYDSANNRIDSVKAYRKLYIQG